MIDDEDFAERSPSVPRETNVPLVQPHHGAHRYRAGSITVTHTNSPYLGPRLGHQQQMRQCSEEALHIRTKTDTRVEKVVYAPYALYRCGNTYHYRSVGYSMGGDIVLLKDEISSNSDAEKSRARSQSPAPNAVQVVNEAVSLENGKMYPGVKVVRGRRPRNRAKNAYLLSKVTETHADAGNGGTPIEVPTPMDDAEEYRQSYFHGECGSVHPKLKKFVDVTEEQQASLFQKLKSPNVAPTPDPNLATNRFARLSKDHTNVLKTTMENAVLMQVLEGLEPSIVQWLDGYSPNDVMNIALEESCHRKILHVIASFYCLRSWSHTVDGQRVTCIAPLKNDKIPDQPSESLCAFLKNGGAPFLLPKSLGARSGRKHHTRKTHRT